MKRIPNQEQTRLLTGILLCYVITQLKCLLKQFSIFFPEVYSGNVATMYVERISISFFESFIFIFTRHIMTQTEKNDILLCRRNFTYPTLKKKYNCSEPLAFKIQRVETKNYCITINIQKTNSIYKFILMISRFQDLMN